VMAEALREGLEKLQRQISKEARAGYTPCLKTEGLVQEQGKQIEVIREETVRAVTNGYHSAKHADKARENTEELLKAIQRLSTGLTEIATQIGEHRERLRTIEDIGQAMEKRVTNLLNQVNQAREEEKETKQPTKEPRPPTPPPKVIVSKEETSTNAKKEKREKTRVI
ncbi:hypothetical protein FRC06_011087, partial [Ceratobasidium sp. 370]